MFPTTSVISSDPAAPPGACLELWYHHTLHEVTRVAKLLSRDWCRPIRLLPRMNIRANVIWRAMSALKSGVDYCGTMLQLLTEWRPSRIHNFLGQSSENEVMLWGTGLCRQYPATQYIIYNPILQPFLQDSAKTLSPATDVSGCLYLYCLYNPKDFLFYVLLYPVTLYSY